MSGKASIAIGGNTYDYAVFNPGVIAQYNEAGDRSWNQKGDVP